MKEIVARLVKVASVGLGSLMGLSKNEKGTGYPSLHTCLADRRA